MGPSSPLPPLLIPWSLDRNRQNVAIAFRFPPSGQKHSIPRFPLPQTILLSTLIQIGPKLPNHVGPRFPCLDPSFEHFDRCANNETTVPAKQFHVLDSNVQITWDLDSIFGGVITIRQVSGGVLVGKHVYEQDFQRRFCLVICE